MLTTISSVESCSCAQVQRNQYSITGAFKSREVSHQVRWYPCISRISKILALIHFSRSTLWNMNKDYLAVGRDNDLIISIAVDSNQWLRIFGYGSSCLLHGYSVSRLPNTSFLWKPYLYESRWQRRRQGVIPDRPSQVKAVNTERAMEHLLDWERFANVKVYIEISKDISILLLPSITFIQLQRSRLRL